MNGFGTRLRDIVMYRGDNQPVVILSVFSSKRDYVPPSPLPVDIRRQGIRQFVFSFFFSRCSILYLPLYIYTNFSLFNASCLEDCDFYLVFIPTSGKHTRTYDIYAEITMFRARCKGCWCKKISRLVR